MFGPLAAGERLYHPTYLQNFEGNKYLKQFMLEKNPLSDPAQSSEWKLFAGVVWEAPGNAGSNKDGAKLEGLFWCGRILSFLTDLLRKQPDCC